MASRRIGLLIAVVVMTTLACTFSDQATPSAPISSPSPTPSTTESVTTVEIAPPSLEVPYVPTPQDIVDRMLAMVKVNRNDVVYDLGSGDGRILITASQRYGARGVGYELDPRRIQEANENARAAGVQDRVKFIKQDLFEADLSAATVVTLYLLPQVNLKLRPKLLRELRPGARIVSHNYGLGDWDPVKTERLDSGNREHLVFYWVVPAKGSN
jgi:SAM-dependent methyltransferase